MITIEAVHCYYESRRRIKFDSTPNRIEIRNKNIRQSKKSQHQKTVNVIYI